MADLLLSISTRMARSWQWLALLLLIVTGLICTLLIVRARHALPLRTRAVIIIALLTRLPALFAAPLLDDDYFRFLWDGHQLAAGLSPYASAPSQHFFPVDLSSAWTAVLSEINHPDIPTIYGPSLQALFALAVALGDADPWPLKLLLVAADLVLVAVLLRVRCPRWMVLMYVVNPLPIKEIGFSLHPDGVIALSMTLALLALARLRPIQAGVCAAVVVCAKLPLVLLAAALNLKNSAHRKAVFACALFSAVAYLPFLFPEPMQPFIGLRAFADGWRFNALGYLVFEAVAGAHARIVLTGFYILCAAVTAFRVADKKVPTATAAVMLLAVILVTAPTVNAWYWLPLLPLAIVAQRQDGVLLLTPWLGSFTAFFGYANGATLADFGLTSTRGEFSVFPVATVIQGLMLIAGFVYDFRRSAVDAALGIVVRIPIPISSALIRWRFAGVKQIAAQQVWSVSATAEPMLWMDIPSVYCALDLGARAQSVTALPRALSLAKTFQQRHRQGLIVVSCAAGYRSSEMAAHLTRAGIANVSNIEGGRAALARLFAMPAR